MATNRKTGFLAVFSALGNQSVIYRGCFSKGKGNSVQFANSHTVIPIWFVAKKDIDSSRVRLSDVIGRARIFDSQETGIVSDSSMIAPSFVLIGYLTR